jgi:2-polyprenyl-3-methyl-5-hydroxy-6-metoxy-1,4-benzoquinol methylase
LTGKWREGAAMIARGIFVANKQNDKVHAQSAPYTLANGQERFNTWWGFAEGAGLHQVEYLLPLAEIKTIVAPFTFEKRKVTKGESQLQQEIQKLGPWAYQIEFDGVEVSTLGRRAEEDWAYHRYRSSLLVQNVKKILGSQFSKKSVLDVACHCGPFAIEFANLGAGAVTAFDLRLENIRQAQWLASTFGVSGIEFRVENARNLSKYTGFDIVFCGGLFYHLTFPTDFMRDLFNCCNDFVIFDTMAHTDPLSAFHLIVNKDVGYSAEGETHYEFHPTYRAVIDTIKSAGFEEVIEVVGTDRHDVLHYQHGVVRSFLAFKPGSESLPAFRRTLDIA